MPLYEFQCESCEHRFEKIQKYTDPVPEVCPACGAGGVRKLASSPAIQFKGTGWYITDYAKKDGVSSSSGDGKSESSTKDDSKNEKADKAAEKSEKAAKSAQSEKSETKTETKSSGSESTTSPAKTPPAPAKSGS